MPRRTHITLGLIITALIGAWCTIPASAKLTSPEEMCAYYGSRWEQGLMRVIQTPPPDCVVQVGDNSSGIGYIKGYYEGGKFCMRSYGAYFTNAGLKESTECIAAVGRSAGSPSTDNPFSDLLKDPNLKWFALAAAIITGAAILNGWRLRRSQTKR